MKLVKTLWNLKFFSKCIFGLLLISISGCSFYKAQESSGIIVTIDSNNLIENDVGLSKKLLQLEVYFLQKNSIFNKEKDSQLSNKLNKLNMPELSRHKISLYYTYNIIPNEIIRDDLIIEANTELLLIVLKKGKDILSNKIKIINSKKMKTFNIELLGTSIRINN